jgi:hypothetical protein
MSSRQIQPTVTYYQLLLSAQQSGAGYGVQACGVSKLLSMSHGEGHRNHERSRPTHKGLSIVGQHRDEFNTGIVPGGGSPGSEEDLIVKGV